LDILKEARLVTGERTGMSVTYSLNASVLQTTLGAFLEFFDTNKLTGKEGNKNETI
ncbi:MAG: ArsR family transcriptional regulator, partial [Lachnospiraceae bacterium]|nr:ArsR family transcriptional regulator [Lachnospiraceae bacterium]